MNVSAITYGNYKPIVNPGLISKASSDNGEPLTKITEKNLKLDPISKETSSKPVAQAYKTDDNLPEENTSNSENDAKKTHPSTTGMDSQALTQTERKLLVDLKQIDTQVRQHEMAHIAAGGQYVTSGASFSYKKGPDGNNYAVGGEVSIDTAPVPGDPQATIEKMRQIKRAALAPAAPSSQDLKVASKAAESLSKALSDLMILQAEQRAKSNDSTAFGTIKNASDSYEKVHNLPEQETSSFQIAV